jgi:TetR/AcrR family transcriptional regulator, regulator of biofilm formation and stress response
MLCVGASLSRPSYGEARAALIEATISLVARDGIAALTHRSVAAEAHVSHGALGHWFGSLDSLLEAALQRCLEISVEDFHSPTSIEELFTPLITALRARPEVQAFQADVVLEARRSGRMRAAVDHHQRAYRRSIETALRDLHVRTDDAIIDALMAAADGIIYQRVAFGDEALTSRQVHGVQQLVNALGTTSRT